MAGAKDMHGDGYLNNKVNSPPLQSNDIQGLNNLNSIQNLNNMNLFNNLGLLTNNLQQQLGAN